jgi:hypothetical protein
MAAGTKTPNLERKNVFARRIRLRKKFKDKATKKDIAKVRACAGIEDKSSMKEFTQPDGEETQKSWNKIWTRERAYLTKLRRLQAEIVLAKERNQLVEKELVGAQAAYMLASMRAKFLSLPTGYARACAHKPVDEIVQILREAVTKALEEVAGFPERVVDPNWLRSLDETEQE